MKRKALSVLMLATFWFYCRGWSLAATYYVATNGTDGTATDWTTAKTKIQPAINLAINGDTVLVSNGTYYLSGSGYLYINKTITLTSVNGPNVTIVDGTWPDYTNRCVYIYGSNAILDGFTIRNGHLTEGWEYGGGIYLKNNNQIKNCIIEGNIANKYGGGVFMEGGIIENCVITDNQTIHTDAYGGGIVLQGGAILRNSLVYGNTGSYGGGVAIYWSWGSIQNCTVVSNTTTSGSGSGGINVVTINSYTSSIENTICYLNISGGTRSNYLNAAYEGYSGSVHIVNNCIAPTNSFRTTSYIEGCFYANNIEANPLFVNKDSNNVFHLSRGSFCIDAGTNESWMTGATDLDGHLRKDRYSGIVDMGCYEYLPQGSMFLW